MKLARRGMPSTFAIVVVMLFIAPSALALDATPSSSTTAPSASTEPPGEVSDPQGDAYDHGTVYAEGTAESACRSNVGSACPSLMQPTDSLGLPEAGLPAPPSLDITHLKLSETPSTLEITLTVASLDEQFSGAVQNDGMRTPVLIACWDCNGEDEQASVGAFAYREGGAVRMAGTYDYGPGFGHQWRVPTWFEEGTPGKIHWSVPRSLIPNGSQSGTLHAPWAASYYQDLTTGHKINTQGAARAYLNGYQVPRVDLTSNGTDFQFLTLESDPPWSQTDSFGPTLVTGEDDRGLTLKATFVENDTTFTIAREVRRVEATPDRIFYNGYFTLSGTWFAANFRITNGKTTTNSYACSQIPCRTRTPVPVMTSYQSGSPGWINITWQKSDIGSPNQDDMLTWTAMNVGVFNETRAGADPVSATDWQFVANTFAVAPPWRFRLPSPHSASMAGKSLFTGKTGDARLPPQAIGADASQFDITYLSVEGLTPTSSRFTVGLADGSRAVVPRGYNAILYAVGVETDQGTFMAAFHKDSSGKQSYFCSQDTAVLVARKRDPTEVLWTPIDGRTFLTGDTKDPQGDGGGTATAIPGGVQFTVPHSCFNLDAPGQTTVKRVAVGTYIVPAQGAPDPVSSVTSIDSLAATGPVVLGSAVAPPPQSRWWVAPFGVDGFWSIFALAATGTGGLIAVLARQRRRTTLQRELRAVEELHDAHRTDPPVWTRAMNTRRAHGADLLHRNRLRPDELLVVERRIELLGADVLPVAPPRATMVAAAGAMLLDRYHIDRLLGEGAQGRAFLARDTKLNREVVVKVLSTIGMDARAKRLLIAEARLAAGIDHPNVVRVFDVQETDSEALLILEYVDGGSLRGLMERRGKLPRGEALRIFRGVLAGLQAAHDRGIVHRDVKPENVLISKDGQPKLADFGAAREARADATIVAGATGTLAYMAPEQVRGLPADARSDLYAAAALLYEMLSGDAYLPVGRVDEYQLRSMILERAPEIRLPTDSMSLTPVLLRALAKTANERYPSAPEFMAALDRATME